MDLTEVNDARAWPATPKRVLYDMSFTVLSGKMSGIERVVRSLAETARCEDSVPHSSQVEFVPIFAFEGRFYRLDSRAEESLSRAAKLEHNCLENMPALYRWSATCLCRVIALTTVRRALLPPSGHLGIFKSWHRRYKRRALRRASAGQVPVEPSADDIVWLPDAYWAHPAVWASVDHARQNGAMISMLFYDLIPLRDGAKNKGFSDYLLQMLAKSHLILCISDCERRNLLEFQSLHGGTDRGCPEMRTITLGCEISSGHGIVRPQFERPFANSTAGQSPTYVCVATFDPRKNHGLLLDAFDALWRQGHDVCLCLIGRVGWQCCDILQRIAEHGELGKRLFVFHDASDAEVNFCYQQARAIITASKDEGFGLPIVESLARGKTILASDIPIHREVGGSACHFFDSTDAASLSTLIRQCQANRLARLSATDADMQAPKIQTWQACFNQCWGDLLVAFKTARTG